MGMSPVQKLVAEASTPRDFAIQMCELFKQSLKQASRTSFVVARFDHEIELLRADAKAEAEAALAAPESAAVEPQADTSPSTEEAA